MFIPPRCPYPSCSQHKNPEPRFFIRKGSYKPLCRSQPVPRFVCRTCRKSFSRQTFRADYRDHKPHLNVAVFLALATGLGLRQTARNVRLSKRCLELKARKIERQLRALNLNLRGPLPPEVRLQFDEIETYEEERGVRPLSIASLIEQDSRYIIWMESGTIPPHGKRSKKRALAIQRYEARHGKRKDRSPRAIRRTLKRGADLAKGCTLIELHTDEKLSYPVHAKEAFGEERLDHQRTSSRLARGTYNPLFPINHHEAMARDLMGRLRRDTWLVSKRQRWLDLALHMWMAYRNYVRRRFNRDDFSPAQMLGFVDRRMRPEELLSWRQDWGLESIHPLAKRSESVVEWNRKRRRR